MDDKRIQQLNKKIVKNKHKIRNLNIKDSVISLTPGVVLLGTVSAYTIANHDNKILIYSYPYLLLLSLGIGVAIAGTISDKKIVKKIEDCETNIEQCMNELHGIALEEDKKIMKLRKM